MALSPQPIIVPPMPAVIPHWRTVELGKLNNKFSYAKDPDDKAWFAIKYGEEPLEVVEVTIFGFDTELKFHSTQVPDNGDNTVGIFLTGGTNNCTYRVRIGVVTGGGDIVYALVHLDVSYAGNQPGVMLTGNATEGPQTTAGAAQGLVPMRAGGTIRVRHTLMSDGLGNVIEANPSDPTYTFLGVSLQPANIGGTLAVAEIGALVDPTWTWVPGLAIYATDNGGLSQVPQQVGFMQQIGVAISPTAMVLQVGPAIDLGPTP